MDIDIKDIVTLNDKNKYLVVSKIFYDKKTYYLLVDVKNGANTKFCYEGEKQNSLIETGDDDIELNRKLLQLFADAAKKYTE